MFKLTSVDLHIMVKPISKCFPNNMQHFFFTFWINFLSYIDPLILFDSHSLLLSDVPYKNKYAGIELCNLGGHSIIRLLLFIERA